MLFFAWEISRTITIPCLKALFNFLFFHEAFSPTPERINFKLFCIIKTPCWPLKIVLRVLV